MINQIINDDCVNGMKQLPSESIDMVITSPPYDAIRDYKGFAFDYESVLKEIYRVLKNGCVCVWIVADQTIDGSESGTSFKQVLCAMDIGFKLHDTMIWEKDSFSFPDSNRYRGVFEYMFVLSKGKPSKVHLIADRRNKYGGMNVHGTARKTDGTTFDRSETWKSTIIAEEGIRFNVWHQPCEKNNKTGHPAPFPIQLVKDHIKSWSNEGDLILDPFMGSGTTAIACMQTNRNYLGFDISKEYCEMAEKRIRNNNKPIDLF